MRRRSLDLESRPLQPHLLGAAGYGDLKGVHSRAANKPGDEQVVWALVQVGGSICLLQNAILHHRDTRAHGHSFGLVVSDVDEGRLQALMELGDLGTGLHTQLGIEVG